MKKITLPLLLIAFSTIPSVKVFSQDNESIIKEYIAQNKLREYKKSDLSSFSLDSVDPSPSMKGEVVKIQQTYNGLPVYNAGASVLIKDKQVIYFQDDFIKDYTSSTSGIPTFSIQSAVDKVSKDLNVPEINTYSIIGFHDNLQNSSHFINHRLVYFTKEDNTIKLAHELTLTDPKTSIYWNFIIDAKNGDLLLKENHTLSCNFNHDAYSHDHSQIATAIGPIQNHDTMSMPLVLAPDNATYNVFPLPVESPTFGSRTTVNNPFMITSSPEGWHYDGTTRYTTTRGNNVYAYEDVADSNAPGVSPDGGPNRVFDYPFSINGTPDDNQNAAITNLFYMNNKMHDVFYKFGFKETSKNFQKTNFGLGGAGNDYVNAEAQDGGGTNNANFNTPQEGVNPRMQMYLWSSSNRKFLYNAPTAAIPRYVTVGTALFGPPLNATGVTGDVKVANILDACTPLTAGSLTGKIGLIERGNCEFNLKVKNAQNAGAIAAIIYTQPGTTIGNMSGTNATITIPSVLITDTEGEYINDQLASGTTVNVTLKDDPASSILPDGSFDNGIIAHEYGHGISNRLTGTGFGCMNSSVSAEQMGEGWSDFFALMLTNQPNATAAVPRGIATYAVSQSTSGVGLRPAKYSPDPAINNYTYGDTNGMEYTNNAGFLVPNVHAIGFVFASALWDLHWKYVEKYGYASDVTANTTSGSSRVLQLVTDALKLQACNPTFIDGRNAILAAELATTNGADKCMIWRVFANRGIGLNASAGTKASINDQVANFDVPTDCLLATNEASGNVKEINIYPNPAKNEFFINFTGNILGKANVEVYDASGKLVLSENKITPSEKKSISTQSLSNGVYIVKVKGLGIENTAKLIIKK